jgi:membrane fusion protein, multidrug efflux system
MKRTFTLLVIAAALGSAAYYYRFSLAPYLPAELASRIGPSVTGAANGTQTGGASSKGDYKKGGGRRGSGGPVAVKIAVAKAGSLPILRDSYGYVQAGDVTSLASPIAGIVTSIAVKNGAEVKKGDVIVTYDSRALEATLAKDKGTLLKDQSTYQNAVTTLDRTKNLGERGASTQQSVDNAAASVQQAQAALVVDKAQIDADNVAISNLIIKAPYDGQLGAVLVSEGAYVGAGTAVASIVNVKQVYAQFTLPESDLELARKALALGTLTVSVKPTSRSDGVTALTGPVSFIDNAVDQASGTFKLWASLDNSARTLWPGESISVTATAGMVDKILIVPGVAVWPDQNGMSTYVVTSDNKAEIRNVAVALRDDDQAGISAGLQAGDKVVVEGQQSLTAGTPVRIEDGMSKPQGSGGGWNGKHKSGQKVLAADMGKDSAGSVSGSNKGAAQ